MPDAFTIREATADDTPIIVTHRRRMFEDMGYTNSPLLDAMCSRFEVWLRVRMAQGLYKTWLVENADGQVVAGGGLWLMDWPPHVVGQSEYRGNLLNVYTETAYRRRGLGKLITQTIMEWCWANDVDVVILHASPDGRHIYESLGFQPTNEMRILKP
jgi:GNAT superfamily N-acetyltransferase